MEMKFETLEKLDNQKFRRLTGVKKKTFHKMVIILKTEDNLKKRRGGRKNKISIEDMLLMTLEYLREYRTYFHIGQSYGISESSAYKNIKWVENTLISHPDFSLPGDKALLEREYETILIDATETPVERPKKNKSDFIRERKKDTQ